MWRVTDMDVVAIISCGLGMVLVMVEAKIAKIRLVAIGEKLCFEMQLMIGHVCALYFYYDI